MKNIFYNRSEGRLATGWRILIFLVLFLTLSSAIFAIKPLIGDLTKREFLEGFSVVIVLILAICATLSTFISRKFLDKKSMTSFGLTVSKKTWMDMAFGILLSLLMAGTFLLILIFLGIAEINGFNSISTATNENTPFNFMQFMSVLSAGSLAVLFFEHILVGYWEEIVFRGYLFQNMTEGMGLKLAIIISCLLYGILHYTNPNAGLLSSAIIVFFGFLRIYGYLATKMLWLSMGMHIGWNFFQGPIFGFAASGHSSVTLLNISLNGPNWLSGGAFGPEGSLLMIPVILMALVIMRWWATWSEREANLSFSDPKDITLLNPSNEVITDF